MDNVKHIPIIESILIVTSCDSNVECDKLHDTLVYHEYDVFIVKHEESIDKAREISPDLLLLDCHTNDGKEFVLKQFSGNSELENIPIIMMHEYDNNEHVVEDRTHPKIIGTLPTPLNFKRIIESIIVVWTAHHLVHDSRSSFWSKLFS
jgi:DNA-binding NtrC family response regulator